MKPYVLRFKNIEAISPSLYLPEVVGWLRILELNERTADSSSCIGHVTDERELAHTKATMDFISQCMQSGDDDWSVCRWSADNGPIEAFGVRIAEPTVFVEGISVAPRKQKPFLTRVMETIVEKHSPFVTQDAAVPYPAETIST